MSRDGVISHDGQIEEQTEKKNCGTRTGAVLAGGKINGDERQYRRFVVFEPGKIVTVYTKLDDNNDINGRKMDR